MLSCAHLCKNRSKKNLLLKKRNLYNSILIAGIFLLVCGCSTKKNTKLSRTYNAFVTHYNIQFNGRESYKEGLLNIQKANIDDYSTLLTMYPVSHHENAQAATANMDKTIEKSRKAIKTRSIKKKPQRDNKKWNNPKYRLFYEQNEFNSALKEAWMLLAKAEFHKADFLGSVGTFSYVSRHYATDKDIVAQCQLWIARAYLEMDWNYEAEQIISKINQDHLKPQTVGLYASVNAQSLLKSGQYTQAVPFLEIVLSKEKDKYQKQRFSFLLGQLYKLQGNTKKAEEYFSKVIRMNPPYEMDFYARINRVELTTDYAKARKQIRKMMKNPNNEDYLDQLYYVNGNTYLAQKDTAKAIEQYIIAAETSTRNGMDKVVALIKTGDLYYVQKKYVEAHPAYDDATKILSIEHSEYPRIAHRAEILGELVAQYNIVTLQDSLLQLSEMSKEEQLIVVNNLIEKMKADEEAAAQRESDAQFRAQQRADMRNDVILDTPPGMIGSGGADWYFYNQTLIKSGRADFQKKWGNRRLEDNWRRTNKSQSLFAEDSSVTPTDTTQISEDTLAAQDSTTPKEQVTDTQSPEFYLQQIPSTAEEKALANSQVATGLYAMGLIYKDKIEDVPMAMKTFEEFERRFGTDNRIPDAYFQQYIMLLKDSNYQQANIYRAKILSGFPDSKYAQILANPDYIGHQQKMYAEQDSIYSSTYAAYSRNDFATVYRNTNYIQRNYPNSTLLPKFEFLSALSVGKTEPRDTFAIKLSNLVSTYPESDVSTMAKDILALMGQGRENQMGTSHGSLIALREEVLRQEEAVSEVSKSFSDEKTGKHRLLLISKADRQQLNELMYQIASYNFSRFMIKDFDLIITPLDSSQTILSVTNLESYDEGNWYEKAVVADATLSNLIADLSIQTVVISEDNFELFRSGKLMSEYLAFETTLAKTQDKPKKEIPKTQDKVEIKVVEIPKPETSTDTTKTATPDVQKTEENVEQKITEEPEQPEAPLYKNLFAIEPNAPHYVALYASSGKVDFDKIKAAFETYNKENYDVMNLKVTLETVAGKEVVLIGNFTDSEVAKSYLLRMVKERQLFEGMKGTNHRNLMGTQRNLNTMVQQNALNTYFEFMQEFYLK